MEIEARNRQLFAKMNKIDKKPLPKFMTQSQDREQIGQNICEGRLRFKSRQIEQVESENRKMLNRLQDAKASYDSAKFHDARKKVEKELMLKCKYPSIFTIQQSSTSTSKRNLARMSLAQSLR